MTNVGFVRAGRCGIAAAFLLAVVAAGVWAKSRDGPKIPPEIMAKFKQYDSPYYVVYSDLEPEKVQSAITRMSAIAREYHERTRGFAGQIKSKFPFYLIENAQDYTAAGGEAYGVTWGDRLMAHADKEQAKELWHIIQHEAWHQFAHNVITEGLPGWIDEGLAEYFGESLWTGDGFVCGVIPQHRYDRFMPRVKDGKIKPFKDIIMIKTGPDWKGIEDYDQALTMIHFFLHASNGKHAQGVSTCLKALAGGVSFDKAFVAAFGPNIDALQKEYLAWWAAQTPDIVTRPYAQAAVATLTSFLARAQGQKFDDDADFLKAARDGSLKKNPKLPLPDDLLAGALDGADKLGDWSLDTKTSSPKLMLKLPDGTVYTGSFSAGPKVTVTVKLPPQGTTKPEAEK